jgi:chemotaxis regulatin CheY-phosphate phosphatase CheZ
MSVEDELPSKIGTLVDYLRTTPDEKIKLTDVASVTEILISTMQSYFRGVDTSIYSECRNLSEYISNARMEIASLQPSDLEEDRIPRAGLELDAIVQQTEEATNTIMESAETIMDALGEEDIKSKSDDMMAAVMNIFEACSFQDITGQRISKVVNTLQHIERRVADIADLMGITDEHISAAKSRDIADDDTDPLLKGPALEGEGIDQAEVDKMLSKNSSEAAPADPASGEPDGDIDSGFDALGRNAEPDGDIDSGFDTPAATEAETAPEATPEPKPAPESEKKKDEGKTSQDDIDALFN